MSNENHEFNIETATKQLGNVELNSKFNKDVFSKGANKGNSPKASSINNMINNIKKKEGE